MSLHPVPGPQKENIGNNDWVKDLRPIWHKISPIRNVHASQSLIILLNSVRPIREFWEMPITYQNKDAPDNRYRYPIWKSQCGVCHTPSHLPPPRYSSTVSELAGRICVWATRLYARIKRPSVYAATVYGSKSRGGVGDTVRKHSVKQSNCGHNLQTSVGSETSGERQG